MTDGTLGEQNRVRQPGCRPVSPGPINAHDLRILEASGSERAIWHLDQTQVAVHKNTIDESAVPKSGLNQRTTVKNAVVELI